MSVYRVSLLTALLLPALATAAAAQDVAAEVTAAPPKAAMPAPLKPGDAIEFAADELGYADNDQIITATGHVDISRDGYRVTADKVTYDRSTGQVIAQGNVVTTDSAGNRAFGDRIELTDSLRDGALDNILLVLSGGGRLAAQSGVRINGKTVMTRAVYTACAVTGPDNCPKEPVWKVRAVKVTHDPIKHRISYHDATVDFLGQPVLFLPSVSHPDGFAERATGLLIPSISFNTSLGVGIGIPWYKAFGADHDLTLKPWVYTADNPALAFEYRHLLKNGPVQVSGLVTYANVVDTAADGITSINRGNRFRGYFAANGQQQHGADWRSTFSLRFATDDTVARRYDISYDDTLRNSYSLEHFGGTSYLSVEGWAFEGLSATSKFGKTPIALPLINFLWNPEDRILGGTLTLNANSLVLTRTDGQDEQRAVASARWDMLRLTNWGQVVTLTGQMRGDVYHSSDGALATLPIYAGNDGWQARFIPAAALDVSWPLAGPAFGGTQTLKPRVQFVLSPTNKNVGIPNEDARSIDLNTIDLFALNRFPGYDRWEGGSRLTYGLEYTLERPRFTLRTQVGQSYRLDRSQEYLPQGTGLAGKVSDVVARTSLQVGPYFELTQSVRVDPNSFQVRSNEIDVAVGGRQTYATVAYVKLNRNIAIEDLSDREELRLGGRVAFAKYWSIYGSSIIDLTSKAEDINTTNNGFSPIRHRLGVAYEDECFRIGLSWRHDYISDRDFRPGNTFQFNIALKNLGL